MDARFSAPRRRLALAAALAAAAVAGLLSPPPAQAYEYWVYECGLGYDGVDASFRNQGDRFAAGDDCGSGGGATAFNKADYEWTYNGAEGARVWSPPAGAAITWADVVYHLHNSDGFAAGVGVRASSGAFAWKSVLSGTQSGDVGSYWARTKHWDPNGFQLEAMVICGWGHPQPVVCRRNGDNRTYSRVRELTFNLDDWSDPVPGLGGALLDGAWHSGTVAGGLTYSGADAGSGIRYLKTYLDAEVWRRDDRSGNGCQIGYPNGLERGLALTPCPTSIPTQPLAIDTASLADGEHRARLCVTDFSARIGCTGEATFYTDNGVPGHPVGLTVAGGTGWRRTNDFDVSWSNASQPGSGVAGAAYRLTRAGGGYDSGRRYAPGAGRNTLSDLTVPGPGEYALKVWLRDEAGNESEANAQTVALRFDDVAPASGRAGQPGGWLGRAGFPYRQEWEPPAREPVSGTAGYATLLDRSPDTDPGSAPTQTGRESLRREIADLPDGVHWFHVVPVSGAGVEGAPVRHVQLRVDKLAPSTEVATSPAREWSGGPVEVRLTPLDPRPPGGADPSGPALVRYRLGDGAEQSLGARGGGLTIDGEGATTLTYRAEDVAGNLQAAQTMTVRIDLTPPVTRISGAGEGWAGARSVTLEATDSLSGPAALQWSVDGGSQQESTGKASLLLQGDGPHVLHYRSIDRAGLAEDWVEQAVRVDGAPPEVAIAGIPDGWSDGDVSVALTATDQGSGMDAEQGAYTAIRLDAGAWQRAAGDVASLGVSAEGVHKVAGYAVDTAGNRSAAIERLVRIDRTPPRAAFAIEQDPRDPEEIRVEASDAASGLAGGQIEYRRADPGGRWEPLATRLEGGRLLAHFPSEELGPDRYQFRAQVIDRAGNAAVATRRTDGEEMALVTPIKVDTSLAVALGEPAVLSRAEGGEARCPGPGRGRGSARARRPPGGAPRCPPPAARPSDYSAPPVVGGRLLTAVGSPLARELVTVEVTPAAGSTAAPRTYTARTDTDGRFRVVLPPGPSRTVVASFEGTSVLGRSRAPRLSLVTRGYVSLGIFPRRLRNGEQVIMRGAVGRRGATLPATGKLVAIEFLDRRRGSRGWRPVALVRTDSGGRYIYGYRFRHILSAQRITFRASLLVEGGWPYGAAASRPAKVVVYPSTRS